MSRFVVMTACDAKYGDFLVEQWLQSLLDHVDRASVDVVIFDYGLTDAQRAALKAHGAQTVRCVANGHIVNIRYRDMRRFLLKSKYEQVLTCDGGDIIFQQGIGNLFKDHPVEFRATREEFLDPFMRQMLIKNPLKQGVVAEATRELRERPAINGGLIVAPKRKFIDLCTFIEENISDRKVFGPDQFILNIYLARKGYHDLGRKYNFIPSMTRERFSIRNGTFLDEGGRPIPIVHNAGNFFRTVADFGYGPGHNRILSLRLIFLRTIRREYTWMCSKNESRTRP